MTDQTAAFIDAMRAAGAGPARTSDIEATDKKIRYQTDDDKPGRKSGECILKIENDGFAVGWFINYREGMPHTWVSKANGEVKTDEERAAFKKKAEERKKEREEEARKLHEEGVDKVKGVWDVCSIAPSDHPYLARKNINGHGCRVNAEGNLLIPMFRDGRMIAYQRITPDSEKKFPYGINIKGAFGALMTRKEITERILICEGFATAASLREATGLTIIIAFNKGNLMAVALTIRAKYPDAQIIICADHDQWTFAPGKKPEGVNREDYPGDAPEWKIWREKGLLLNEGLSKATAAAGAVGGSAIPPPFANNDPEKPTDYNDLRCRAGLSAVSDRINEVPEPQLPVKKKMEIRQPDDWQQGALVKRVSRDGQQIWWEENSYNYSHIVKNHPRLEGVFAWDEFHLCPMIVKCPPWPKYLFNEDKFKVGELDEPDIRECDYFIQNIGVHLKGNEGKTRGAIEDAALANPIHPLRDYFDGLKWDLVPRLDDWLINYCFCVKDDPDIVRAFGRTWMIAAVMRVYKPGSKFDHMLILEGEQGSKKTTALETLATFGEGEDEHKAFQNTFRMAHCDDPDELMKLTGALIVEIQEMADFSRRGDEVIKAFITTTEDCYRAPYARKTKKWKRQFVLAGTYNPKEGIFRDPTGLRRFWVVTVGKKIDIISLKRDREQLWAEAVHRYKAGEGVELSPHLYAKAEITANKRRYTEDMTHDVLEAARGRRGFETRDIMRELGIQVRASTQSESRTIGNILRVEGFRREQIGRKWVWNAPDDQMAVEYEEEITTKIGDEPDEETGGLF